jgi:AcrR family transcriptional regulator
MTQPYHHGSLRQGLLEAAETLLERDGIGALTLRAAARQAGVSHAAPTHHFRDLAGLLSELAASGFVRFRNSLLAEAEAAGPEGRLIGMGRGYVKFARSFPGLFLLMFRSERLDWSLPALSQAGAQAFALLNEGEANAADPFQNLVAACTRWSLIHGLATLLVDDRLGPMAQKVPGADLEVLIEKVLSVLSHPEP